MRRKWATFEEKLDRMFQESVILDMSGVCRDEFLPVDVPSRLVDCRDLAGTSCYLSDEAREEILRRISDCPLEAVHWIDSGDYHYLTKLWADRIRERFSLVLYDNHPDMQAPAFGEILSCGGWVRSLLREHPFLEKVYLVGTSDALAEETRWAGERVVRLPAGPVPVTGAVYLSIDRDVLDWADARTDWDQGSMRLPVLLRDVKDLAERCRILGVDICGARPSGKGGTAEDFAVNRRTARELADLFLMR